MQANINRIALGRPASCEFDAGLAEVPANTFNLLCQLLVLFPLSFVLILKFIHLRAQLLHSPKSRTKYLFMRLTEVRFFLTCLNM